MKKCIVEGIEVETGSGNDFADLGLPDADKLKIKSRLVIEIIKAVKRQGLSQAEAAERMGLTQPLSVRYIARRLLEPFRAKADGLLEPDRLRHPDSREACDSAYWATDTSRCSTAGYYSPL